MFVDPKNGMDCNSGLSPDQALCSIQAAMDKLPFLHEQHKIDKMIEDRIMVIRPNLVAAFRGQPPVKKKEYPEWPPEVDNLNEEWWK